MSKSKLNNILKDYVGVAEAAQIAKISETSIHKRISRNTLEYIKVDSPIPCGYKYMIKRSSLESLPAPRVRAVSPPKGTMMQSAAAAKLKVSKQSIRNYVSIGLLEADKDGYIKDFNENSKLEEIHKYRQSKWRLGNSFAKKEPDKPKSIWSKIKSFFLSPLF